ncbi:MAG: outer membrane lipoprotein-sorting protein [Deltaproteobacteria bacterium]|nr:outer membrane lipoprotein-sorting protein [Deltaproteobacteria bacterium]
MIRSPRLFPSLLILFSLLLGSPALSEGGLDTLADCIRANFPEQSSIQEVTLRTEDRGGSSRQLTAKIWWQRFKAKRSRVLIQVRSPEDVRGASVLLIERDDGTDLFLYSPELKKTRRINSHSVSGSLFGSDFTYEDFQQLQGLAMAGATERLSPSALDGVTVDAFVQKKDPESGSAYEKIITYVTRKSCIPMKSEMFAPGGTLQKVMRADLGSMIERDGVRIPSRLSMEDVLEGSTTTLEVTSLEVDVKIKRRIFELATLGRSVD